MVQTLEATSLKTRSDHPSRKKSMDLNGFVEGFGRIEVAKVDCDGDLDNIILDMAELLKVFGYLVVGRCMHPLSRRILWGISPN